MRAGAGGYAPAAKSRPARRNGAKNILSARGGKGQAKLSGRRYNFGIMLETDAAGADGLARGGPAATLPTIALQPYRSYRSCQGKA